MRLHILLWNDWVDMVTKKKTKVKEVKADKIHPLKVMMHSRVQRRKFPWMALHRGSEAAGGV